LLADYQLGYDPGGNRWVSLAVRGSAPFNVSTGLAYDPKRRLVWLVSAGPMAGDVFVLRFDAATADVKAVGDLAGPPAATSGRQRSSTVRA